jgi:uncharacterized membrane protein
MKSFTRTTDPTFKPKVTGWTLLEKIALAAFIIWSAAGLAFTTGRISPATIAQWNLPAGLGPFIVLCLQNGDPILILLAFINTHLHATRQWTSGIARRWALLIVGCSFAIETFGARTGIPFGQYHYTDNFGPVLGLVPITIPLAWHVVVTNALFLVRAVAPHLSRLVEAALAGLICTAYDFILEPFATVTKNYWVWTEGSVPPINYVAWFVLSALLIRIFAPTLSNRFRFDPRPALILGLTVAIFIAGRM